MNCAEFQEFVPEVLEGARNPEQEAHLKSCPVCSGLVADLDLISSEARQLQALDEPSPRVWNSIEIALRREGLIRESGQTPSLLPPVARRWSLAWLVPVAAIILVTFGIFIYQRGSGEQKPTAQLPAAPPAVVANLRTSKIPANIDNEDQQLLEAMASRSPAVQAQYATSLKNVNAYIRDAEESAQADPNDEDAQQIVMDAYEQRAAVYEMALDRSLP